MIDLCHLYSGCCNIRYIMILIMYSEWHGNVYLPPLLPHQGGNVLSGYCCVHSCCYVNTESVCRHSLPGALSRRHRGIPSYPVGQNPFRRCCTGAYEVLRATAQDEIHKVSVFKIHFIKTIGRTASHTRWSKTQGACRNLDVLPQEAGRFLPSDIE